MTSAYSINLNFNNTIPVKTDFTFKQGDKGITLNLVTTGLDPAGTTAHIVFKRSNGTSVEAELTGQTGPSYSYTILGNEFEIPGVVVADLKLYNGDTQRVSTASFIFLVTGDTMDGVGGGTGGYSDQLEQLSQEFADTLEQYEEAFADVGAVHAAGNYDPTTEYSPLDLVYYATDNSTYLCVEQCTGETPSPSSSYWQLVVAGGGSGGTDDYDDLENKPQINSVTLSGNKSLSDLGIDIPSDLSELDEAASTRLDNLGRYVRQDITNKLANLPIAVSEKNLAKYGYTIGDYFERTDGARTYTYTLADFNTFLGVTTPKCITNNHLVIVVDTHSFSAWDSGTPGTVGYSGSTLHSYLSQTVLDNIKADMIALFGGSTGLEHLYAHSKQFTTALANWAWFDNQYISAITCSQAALGSYATANQFQEGEAGKPLELFRKYKWTEIFGAERVYLRNISNYDSSGSRVCRLNDNGNLVGDAYPYETASSYCAGIIVFH